MFVYENGIFFLAIYCTSLTFGDVCCIFAKSGRHIRSHYNAKSLFSMPFQNIHIFSNLPTAYAYAYACQLISSTLSICVVVAIFAANAQAF